MPKPPPARSRRRSGQRLAMAPQLELLAKDEQKAAAVQGWLDESINLLAELDGLGQQLRPKPLDAPDFKADGDVVVTKLAVTNRQIALEAAARAATALPPIEQRLRAAKYTADRGAIDPASKAVPGYGVGVTTVLHTWTRELRFHPHVHCIVTGGGLSLDGQRHGRGSLAGAGDEDAALRARRQMCGDDLQRVRRAHGGPRDGRDAQADHVAAPRDTRAGGGLHAAIASAGCDAVSGAGRARGRAGRRRRR